ncbi:MAG: pyruvate kinase [Proteobacteria bacterium]|nr:pyruvate kinase [Pseudomonadota bacterium]
MINTKIICTIGPASNSYSMLQEMYNAGMNIARLNMSHGDHTSHAKVVEKIKKLNRKVQYPVGLLLDTQGPEIRTGLAEMDLVEGETIQVNVPPAPERVEGCLYINYPYLVDTVEIGQPITVDSGLINLEVLSKGDHSLQCRVLYGGHIKGRRHVNLPGTHVKIPAITEKDKADIQFGIEHDIDFIALSFVRDITAVHDLREILKTAGRTTKIIAKIENYEGVDNLEEIIKEVDGIMVARGDLGIEVDMEDLPNIQRQMAYRCAIHGKCLVIATHLLESMIEHPIPTRAEVTDIANAVFEEADAVMLSGETASGKFPIRAIQHLVKTAHKSEQYPGVRFAREMIKKDSLHHIAAAAVQLVGDLKLKGMVVFTQSGRTAAIVSSFRPENIKIYAFTNSPKTQAGLILHRSVYPFLMTFDDDFEQTVQNALKALSTAEDFQTGDQVIVIHDIGTDSGFVQSIQVRDVFPR